MNDVSERLPVGPTSRERSLLAVYRVADTLGCRPEAILKTANSDSYPDATAELVRLWFKLGSPTAQGALLRRAREMAGRKSH